MHFPVVRKIIQNQKSLTEENPLALYLKNSGLDNKTTKFINSGDYEMGYKFILKEKGKITAITFKIPDDKDHWAPSTAQAFPNNISFDYDGGDLSIVFKKDN